MLAHIPWAGRIRGNKGRRDRKRQEGKKKGKLCTHELLLLYSMTQTILWLTSWSNTNVHTNRKRVSNGVARIFAANSYRPTMWLSYVARLVFVHYLSLQRIFFAWQAIILLYRPIYIHLYSPHNMVIQEKKTGTSKNTTNEKREKNNDNSTVNINYVALNSEYPLQILSHLA